MTGPVKPLAAAILDAATVPLWWAIQPSRRRERPWSSGFSPAVDHPRLEAIRWRAGRTWPAWHVHDIRFLLSIIDDLATVLELVLVDVAAHEPRAEKILHTIRKGSTQ